MVKLVLTLFQGQASVEQEFSISNIVHNNNMKEHTIMAKKYIIDHMNSHKLKPHTVEINKDLLKSVKSVRSKWELAREEKKQHQKKTDLENQKTLISKNIEQVKEKCDSLKKAINIMESEFVESIKQSVLENIMALFIKNNGLKKKSEETKQDLSTLEKLLSELNEKKRKFS